LLILPVDLRYVTFTRLRLVGSRLVLRLVVVTVTHVYVCLRLRYDLVTRLRLFTVYVYVWLRLRFTRLRCWFVTLRYTFRLRRYTRFTVGWILRTHVTFTVDLFRLFTLRTRLRTLHGLVDCVGLRLRYHIGWLHVCWLRYTFVLHGFAVTFGCCVVTHVVARLLRLLRCFYVYGLRLRTYVGYVGYVTRFTVARLRFATLRYVYARWLRRLHTYGCVCGCVTLRLRLRYVYTFTFGWLLRSLHGCLRLITFYVYVYTFVTHALLRLLRLRCFTVVIRLRLRLFTHVVDCHVVVVWFPRLRCCYVTLLLLFYGLFTFCCCYV